MPGDGPAPKDPSLRQRRNAPTKGFVTLPSSGREGDAPAWPLRPDVTVLSEKRVADNMVESLEEAMATEDDGRKRRTILRQLEKAQLTAERLAVIIETSGDAELALWNELWATPQAVEWERSHAHRAVAIFVRWQVKAESGDIEATKEARMWSDRLGMNPLALQKLRQEVENADGAEERGNERRQRRTPPAGGTQPAAKAGKAKDPRSILSAVS